MRRMWIGGLAAILLPYVITLAWSGVTGIGADGVSGYDGRLGNDGYGRGSGSYDSSGFGKGSGGSDVYGAGSAYGAGSGKIYLGDGSQGYLDLETYLIGVVARQIPADYEMEALKAQAILARTYICRQMDGEGEITEEELGLSYVGENQMETLWGSRNFVEYYDRISQAVEETEGLVMVWEAGGGAAGGEESAGGEGSAGTEKSAGNGEDAKGGFAPAEFPEPMFHRASTGITRQGDAAHSYLQPVDSPWDVEEEGYLTILEWEPKEVADLLKAQMAAGGEEIQLTESQVMETIQLVGRDRGGYVNEIQIGTHIYTGDEVRLALGLPSPAFTLEPYEGKVRGICKGMGHGYGLSQCGANAMAKEGKSAGEILNYYYQEIAIISLKS